MRFFSTFLLLFLFLFSFSQQAKGQNLIYDWSVEEYSECPYLLTLEMFVPNWIQFRAQPDYFNTCSPTLGPLTNPFGWQHPRTGEGLMGVVTFSNGLPNAREYPGVQLLEPLVIGESYDISYHVALAYNQSVSSNRASNNLGILLMTENYLTFDELGIIPNFAHHNVDTLITDTAHWVHVGGTIVADSVYQFVAFGNFFDDSNTTVISFNPNDPSPGNLAYYYFDDFCVVPAGGECNVVLNSAMHEKAMSMSLFPNPSRGELNINSTKTIKSVNLVSLEGQKVQHSNQITRVSNNLYHVVLTPHILGMYIIELETEEGIMRKKVVIQP